MSLFGQIRDFANGISGMGGRGDHGGAQFTIREPIGHETIAAIMSQVRLVRRAVEAAPKDIIRAWRTFEEDDAKFQAIEDRFNYEERLEEALIYAAAFGGAFIIPKYDGRFVGLRNMQRPFVQPPPGSLLGFRVFKPCELSAESENRGDAERQDNGLPVLYSIERHADRKKIFNRDALKIHHTWVQPVHGEKLMTKGRFYGKSCEFLLGNSMVDGIYGDLCRDAAGLAALSHLLARANIDVLSGPGIAKQIKDCSTPEEAQKVILQAMTRAATGIQAASNTQPMVIDSMEELKRHGLGAGAAGAVSMSEALTARLIASTGVPRTKLMGEQSKGLNNGGEVDLKYYYDDVASMRRRRAKAPMAWMDGLIAADTEETMPKWKFGDLWQRTEKEIAETDKIISERDKNYLQGDLPLVKTKIAEDLARRGVYNFTEGEIGEIKLTEGSLDLDGAT